ncbi:hypothetical protein Rsub_03805 [Raphidocelis subcapitata]|uniref:Uncharacterized protein n=1 Tax=Raphidocelis subcapitata TaxID=307507 RepID=A0A2V0NZD0_9CHLO|nr:hypothetical protein Rsub_03805 [Raphidocelis subcapitata]|eukprot:GBF90950.1 hypothetical protein Rsub_03805 [Raphidocelis subcapitata]
MADAKALLEAFWSVGRAMALAQGGVGGAEEVFEPRVGSASSVSGSCADPFTPLLDHWWTPHAAAAAPPPPAAAAAGARLPPRPPPPAAAAR